MADINETEIIGISESGRLQLIPNPAYHPPLATAASSPHGPVGRADQRAVELIVIDSSSDEEDSDEEEEEDQLALTLPHEMDFDEEILKEDTGDLVAPAISSLALEDNKKESAEAVEYSTTVADSLTSRQSNGVELRIEAANVDVPAVSASTFAPPNGAHHSFSIVKRVGLHRRPRRRRPDSIVRTGPPPDDSTTKGPRRLPSLGGVSDLTNDERGDDFYNTILPDMDLEIPIASRTFWEPRVRIATEGNLTINAVLNRLDLRRSSGSGARGAVSFDHGNLRRLTHAVIREANALPVDDAEKLVDIASQPESMGDTVVGILAEFGRQVWGPEAKREWLMEVDGGGLRIDVWADYAV